MELGIGVTKGKEFFTYICTFFTSIYLQRSLKEFFCSSLVVESKAKMFLMEQKMFIVEQKILLIEPKTCSRTKFVTKRTKRKQD